MSEELKQLIIKSMQSRSGHIPLELKKEFVSLCREKFNYNVDMSCGKCIFKYIEKLSNEI